MDFLNRRLIIVAGKGGVGKTTVAVALGIAAARGGKNALIAETGGADAVGPLFGHGRLGNEPQQIAPRIQGATIDPKAELANYVQEHIGGGFIANRITGATLFEAVAEAAPGLREIMTLGRIWRWERERTDAGTPRYDLIVVDGPATGHGLSLLSQPQALVDMLRAGPLVGQIHDVQILLRDPEKTRLLPVTLPEELPVNETILLVRRARRDLRMTMDSVVVNAVYPDRFLDKDGARIAELADKPPSGDPSVRAALAVARTQIRQRERQAVHIDRLTETVDLPMIHIPFFFKNDMGLRDVERIAKIF